MAAPTTQPTPNQCLLCGLHVTLHRGRHGEPLTCQEAADACRYSLIRSADLRELMLREVER